MGFQPHEVVYGYVSNYCSNFFLAYTRISILLSWFSIRDKMANKGNASDGKEQQVATKEKSKECYVHKIVSLDIKVEDNGILQEKASKEKLASQCSLSYY